MANGENPKDELTVFCPRRQTDALAVGSICMKCLGDINKSNPPHFIICEGRAHHVSDVKVNGVPWEHIDPSRN
jgi:hypothetical protein